MHGRAHSIFELGEGHDPQGGPMLMGSQPRKAADAVLSILGALSLRTGPLRLGLNPIRLRTQQGMGICFSLGWHTPRGRWGMSMGVNLYTFVGAWAPTMVKWAPTMVLWILERFIFHRTQPFPGFWS